jgi:propionyl-CoA synthetase
MQQPEVFWKEAAQAIDWDVSPENILDSDNAPLYRWFSDGKLNTCYNALDRHIENRGDQTALIYDSPVTNTKKTFTYRELRDEVAFEGI